MSRNPGFKRIIFLSGSDFKEKSIQVIRKTPEAYVAAGWDVHYVVGRDSSKNGDYFYEAVVNPTGLKIYRFFVPLAGIHGLSNNPVWMGLWFRIRTILLIVRLMQVARRVIKNTGSFDVIYGYEVPGVLAARLLRFLTDTKKTAFVIRFQGVLHVKEWLRKKQLFRKLSNWEAILALRTRADLTIMTNDGSQGLDVLEKLKAPKQNKVLFLVNGVERKLLVPEKLEKIKHEYYTPEAVNFLSVSRLDGHKRLDRGIRIIHSIKKKCGDPIRYVIVGGGAEFRNLSQLIAKLGLKDCVFLAGPVDHEEVHYHFSLCDFLISMYTSSNVGNPLLEAIRYNKPVITLNNGDTGAWIRHRLNGLIYDIDDDKDLSESDYDKIADDIIFLLNDREQLSLMKANLLVTEREKLWTWDERFRAELSEVHRLLK